MFAYQAELKQAREAAAQTGAFPAGMPPPAGAKTTIGEPNPFAMDIGGKEPSAQLPGSATAMTPVDQPSTAKPVNIIQKTFRNEALARLQRATLADCGFLERLVTFWSNHFCISAGKGGLARMWAGSFEREAIRPHILGRFCDMLKAVEQHPAMLFFSTTSSRLARIPALDKIATAGSMKISPAK